MVDHTWLIAKDCQDKLIAQRLLDTPLLGILASHPQRNAFRAPQWQMALDNLLQQAKRNGEMVLYPSSAPYSQSIAFACQYYGLIAVGIQTRSNDSRNPRNTPKPHWLNSLSIELQADSLVSQGDTNPDDTAVCILANRLVALNVTPNGKIAALLEQRLQWQQGNSENSNRCSTWIQAYENPSRAQAKFQHKLSAMGAVLWFPNRPCYLPTSPWECEARIVPATVQPIGPLPAKLAYSKNYLIHTTRARQEHWPDQSQRYLLDEAFQLAWSQAPTPLDTLLRIASSQRIFATNAYKRGSLATVSFTANSLRELVSMRGYQSHLARWDWEPFGIAIRLDLLESLGCKKVRYLPSEQIDRLGPLDQAFCQPSPKRPGDRDWTSEKEWRLPSDLRLAQLPTQGVFYFVAESSQAKALAHYTRWPVYWTNCLSD